MKNKTRIDARPDIDCSKCPAETKNGWWLIFERGKYPNDRFPCPSWKKHLAMKGMGK